jgi:glycosyltransferase involved in cell wall biosynthesis
VIEAKACGIPAIVFNRISRQWTTVSPVISAKDVQSAADALYRLDDLSHTEIRTQFESRFSAGTMAQNYLGSYKSHASCGNAPGVLTCCRGLIGALQLSIA